MFLNVKKILKNNDINIKFLKPSEDKDMLLGPDYEHNICLTARVIILTHWAQCCDITTYYHVKICGYFFQRAAFALCCKELKCILSVGNYLFILV